MPSSSGMGERPGIRHESALDEKLAVANSNACDAAILPAIPCAAVLPLLALFGICMALNTVPSLVATTAVVTLFAFRDDVGAVEAVVVGVAGAVIGRVLFALAIRHGADRFIRGRLRQNIDFLRGYVGKKRHATRFLALLAMMGR